MAKILKQNLPLFILLVLAFLTRFLFLDSPGQVVFDEVYFGKFVSSYFSHQYYFDIHPPLGKLMIAGAAKLLGYESGFDFNKIGENFNPYFLFILRFLPALFGAFFVFLIYGLVLALGLSKKAAFLASFLVLFDNAVLTQSKFILVDVFLLFFGFASLYFFVLAKKLENSSRKKVFLYIISAVFAGLAFSVKWTGLSFLGIIMFFIFWDFLTNLKVKKLLRKLLIFTFLPLLIYVAVFAVHFNLLKFSGPGDAFMTPDFQKTLLGSKIAGDTQPLSFLGKFTELNKAMYKYNASIKTGHPNASRWHEWPLMKKPIWYWTSPNLLSQNLGGQPQNKAANIYFLGNPITWWLTALVVPLSFILISLKRFRKKLSSLIYFLLFGYLINLLPFIFVSRVAFLYHYLPALIFGIIILAVIYDKVLAETTQKEEKPYKIKKFMKEGKLISPNQNFLFFPGKVHFFFYFIFLTAVFAVFLFLAPLTYGFPVSLEKYQIYKIFLQFLS